MKIICKISLVIVIIISCIFNSFGAVVSDNDGSAFITKAEFDSLKNNFQSQIDTYNSSIDSKIDMAISAYLAGINLNVTNALDNLYSAYVIDGVVGPILWTSSTTYANNSNLKQKTSFNCNITVYGVHRTITACERAGYWPVLVDNGQNRFYSETDDNHIKGFYKTDYNIDGVWGIINRYQDNYHSACYAEFSPWANLNDIDRTKSYKLIDGMTHSNAWGSGGHEFYYCFMDYYEVRTTTPNIVMAPLSATEEIVDKKGRKLKVVDDKVSIDLYTDPVFKNFCKYNSPNADFGNLTRMDNVTSDYIAFSLLNTKANIYDFPNIQFSDTDKVEYNTFIFDDLVKINRANGMMKYGIALCKATSAGKIAYKVKSTAKGTLKTYIATSASDWSSISLSNKKEVTISVENSDFDVSFNNANKGDNVFVIFLPDETDPTQPGGLAELSFSEITITTNS